MSTSESWSGIFIGLTSNSEVDTSIRTLKGDALKILSVSDELPEIEKYITVVLEPISAFITIIDGGIIYEFGRSC